jgi:SAM-dependent methyltransferase
MSFDAGADAYDRFMGRYSRPLAMALLAQTGIRPGHRVLDVGCGSGLLTAAIADVVGRDHVVAVDPARPFAEAVREAVTGSVAIAEAEHLPFADRAFDASLAQLVVHFMTDPVSGLMEMARVTRIGGEVAVNVWDHGGAAGPLATFWRAVRDLDPDAPDESALPGVRAGDLADLCRKAGLAVKQDTSLTVTVRHDDFEEWWAPFLLGVGPAGAYVVGLEADRQVELRERCRELQPRGSFTVDARAWTVFAEVT